jgi:DNA-binding NtrC family response regulator
MAKILCVDDQPEALEAVRVSLERGGHQVVAVKRVEAALTVLDRGGIDLIVSDYRMPEINGLEFLGMLEERGDGVPLVMMTGHGSIDHAVTAIKKGAIDYITKPVGSQELNLAVDQALEFVRLKRENARLRAEGRQRQVEREIVGDSPAFQKILDTIAAVAPSRGSVLLQGESGSGKEVLARAIHDTSDRADGPFVSINCAALPESLVESILFGHEKGAFTGAVSRKEGAFERANGGTLLLDEISEMRIDLQAKLLRVLQEREFERLGATTTTQVDVRIVATTNRDLRDEVREGRFREDLYYRLSVVPLLVPPLRERREDIPALVRHFVQKTATELGRPVPALSSDAMDFLTSHDWPGNVRELAHAVERAVLLSRGDALEVSAFDRERFGLAPAHTSRDTDGNAASSDGGEGGVRVVLNTLDIRAAEATLIERALDVTDGNRTHAAELLGISVRTLRSKLNG